MEKAFLHFIETQKLFTNEHKLLLAFSGGKDSVCLFHLLLQSGFRFEVAHCNFQLRGEESQEDEAFVKKMAESHGIPFHVKHFDTQKLKTESGLSTQEMARKLRYDWFFELAESFLFDKILTAHHLNDNTETFFINILRNTGISGLHGIPSQNNRIVRPLLMADSKEIKLYIETHQLLYREDSSNKKNDYLRNNLRNNILPLFETVDKDFNKTIHHVTQKVLVFENLALELIKNKWQEIALFRQNYTEIPFIELDKMENKVMFFYANVRAFGFNFEQVENLFKEKKDGFSKMILSKTHQIFAERDSYIIKSLSTQETEPQVFDNIDKLLGSGVFEFEVCDIFAINFEEKNGFCLALDKIHFPVIIRVWQKGDKMLMLGMKGRKKISDILTDKKVEQHLKPSIRVMEDANGNILYLENTIVSEWGKMDATSKAVLRIR